MAGGRAWLTSPARGPYAIRGIHSRAGGGVSSSRPMQGQGKRGDALLGGVGHIQINGGLAVPEINLRAGDSGAAASCCDEVFDLGSRGLRRTVGQQQSEAGLVEFVIILAAVTASTPVARLSRA